MRTDSPATPHRETVISPIEPRAPVEVIRISQDVSTFQDPELTRRLMQRWNSASATPINSETAGQPIVPEDLDFPPSRSSSGVETIVESVADSGASSSPSTTITEPVTAKSTTVKMSTPAVWCFPQHLICPDDLISFWRHLGHTFSSLGTKGPCKCKSFGASTDATETKYSVGVGFEQDHGLYNSGVLDAKDHITSTAQGSHDEEETAGLNNEEGNKDNSPGSSRMGLNNNRILVKNMHIHVLQPLAEDPSANQNPDSYKTLSYNETSQSPNKSVSTEFKECSIKLDRWLEKVSQVHDQLKDVMTESSRSPTIRSPSQTSSRSQAPLRNMSKVEAVSTYGNADQASTNRSTSGIPCHIFMPPITDKRVLE